MSDNRSSESPDISVPATSVLAGFLSYLVPGLGQIMQGRTAKGIMFMVLLLSMFVGGQAMGDYKNVFLPNEEDVRNINPNIRDTNPWRVPPPLTPIGHSLAYQRWAVGAQFWMGVASWPAIWQYYQPREKIVLLHDPAAPPEKASFWKTFQRAPRNEAEVNTYLTNSDKTPDVALLYTIIAGMLNILVIYDAYAGPVHVAGKEPAASN